ncbi:hypothetical protein ACKWTF_002810 [Chironomus riparius]
MLRNIRQYNHLSNVQCSIFFYSTQAARKVNFQDEWNNAKPYENIPKLSKFQLIRGFLPGGKFRNANLMELHRILNKEYGSVVEFPQIVGRPSMLCTYNVDDFEKVLRHEGAMPHRRTLETLQYYRQKFRSDIYGVYGGLFTEQGEDWHKMRMLLNPVLLPPKTIQQYVPRVDNVTKLFIKTLAEKIDGNGETPSNTSDYLNMWSLESIANISLDTQLGIVGGKYKDEMAEKLIKSIRKFFIEVYQFEINISIWKYYQTKAFKGLLQIYDDITNIVLFYVERAIEELPQKSSNEYTEESILEKLLKIDKNLAVVMCTDALLAGVDTTSSASIGILYCLAKNQDKQDKLREEIRGILKNEDDDLTPKNMQNMPYLRACIKEGLRLCPPTAGTIRKAGEDLVLSGYRVPKGTDIVMPVAVLSQECYTKKAEFIPERWLKGETHAECPHANEASPFSYLPFGYFT